MARKSKRNAGKAKKPNQQKKLRQKPKQRRRRAGGGAGLSNPANPTFGALSTINTAPVAIGNSMRGVRPQIVTMANGVAVVGRDYCYTPISTNTQSNWILVGGIPLNPTVFPSSILRNTAIMYEKFRFRKAIFHYITSSSTSTTGDIMFYTRRNEGSGLPAPTTTSFLPFVLSDSMTVIGPQWTNHTIELDVSACPWLSTDYGATPEPQVYNQYDVFLYSKTSSTDSPGYVLIDYICEFKELAINPRAGAISTIAGSRAVWQYFGFNVNNNATAGTTVLTSSGDNNVVHGFSPVGLGASNGDVFECIMDATNSTFSATTATNAFDEVTIIGTYQNSSYVDGKIFYAVWSGSAYNFYWTVEQAFTVTNPIRAGATVQYAEVYSGLGKKIGSVANSQLVYSQ